MKIKFNMIAINKKEDLTLLVLNNEIDTESMRIKYNPNAHNLWGKHKTMFNAFKKEINQKFNLHDGDSVRENINMKILMLESFEKDKTEGFYSYSGKYFFDVGTSDVFNKYWKRDIIGAKNPMWYGYELVE